MHLTWYWREETALSTRYNIFFPNDVILTTELVSFFLPAMHVSRGIYVAVNINEHTRRVKWSGCLLIYQTLNEIKAKLSAPRAHSTSNDGEFSLLLFFIFKQSTFLQVLDDDDDAHTPIKGLQAINWNSIGRALRFFRSKKIFLLTVRLLCMYIYDSATTQLRIKLSN